MGIVDKLSLGLGKTRARIAGAFHSLFSGGPSQDYAALEELLLLADAGPQATAAIVAKLKTEKPADLVDALKRELVQMLSSSAPDLPVKLFVGVNGTGKTTSLGKLCHLLASEGKRPFVIGADTFRAAADLQLESWCRRLAIPCHVGRPGSDPAAVVFDGLNSTAAQTADCILCDTAGRLHSNKNLIQELKKILRVAERVRPGAVEVLLTLDAAVGQNAIAQAEVFAEALGPLSLVLSKLDGSAKGGVAIALAEKFKFPIKYIGIGEGISDLVPFSAPEYVDSLFS